MNYRDAEKQLSENRGLSLDAQKWLLKDYISQVEYGNSLLRILILKHEECYFYHTLTSSLVVLLAITIGGLIWLLI